MKSFIQHKSLVDQIVQGLEKRILEGSLKPGERIVEDALCRTLGVSRSPLREAFRILESMGFVTREPRKGISVATITPQEAEDIYQIRAHLESLAIRLAVKKQSPEILNRLRKLHRQMRDAAAKDNTNAYFALNLKFHEILTTACENKPLIHLINTFSKQTMRYRLEAIAAPGWMVSSLKTHEAMIKLYESGNAEKAEEVRRMGVLNHLRRFSPKLRKEEEGEDRS
jgi:DNA-binding GntR family transcriptional regulator